MINMINYKRIAYSPIAHLMKQSFLFVNNEADKGMEILFGYPEDRVIILSDILGG